MGYEMVIRELWNAGKKTSKKGLEKFGTKEKSATFAPAITAQFFWNFETTLIKKIFEKKVEKRFGL